MVEFDIGGCAPEPFGVTVPEAAFRRYVDYARTVMINRRKLIPMLQKSREGDGAGVDALSADIMRCACRRTSFANRKYARVRPRLALTAPPFS